MTIRRMKTYTGGQGYVYQYYFVGQRPAPAETTAPPTIEYIFDVTSDRKTTYAVSVLLPQDALKFWAAAHGRALTDAEEYAAVKLRLFKAFDEVDDMMAHGRTLRVDPVSLEEAMATLGVD